MNEDIIIRKLLFLIAQKENFKEFSNWTNSDYEYLSDQILKKTNSYISDRTLRRLIEGYVLGKKKIRPTISTLNIISCFAGHENWHKYRHYSTTIKKNKKQLFTRQSLSVITVFLIIILLSFGLFTLFNKASLSGPMYKNNFPNTLTLVIPNKPLFPKEMELVAMPDQPVIKSIQYKTIVPPEKKKASLNLKEPGFYHLRLQSGKKVYDQKSFFLLNNAWTFSVFSENKTIKIHEDIKPAEGIVEINTQDQKQSEDRLMTDISYFSKTQVVLDSCMIDLRVRNHYIYFDELSCNLFKVIFYGMKNNITLQFGDESCYNQTKIKVGTDRYEDRFEANPMLHRDYSQWTDISIKIEQQKLELFIDNQPCQEMTFSNSLDTLMGIKFWFLEGGSIDYIRFYDLQNTLRFGEEF